MWRFFPESCTVTLAQNLRLDHVRQYVKYRLEASISPSTVNNHLSSLRSFLAFLKEDGLQIDPSLENVQSLKEPERLPRYMTSKHLRGLRDELVLVPLLIYFSTTPRLAGTLKLNRPSFTASSDASPNTTFGCLSAS